MQQILSSNFASQPPVRESCLSPRIAHTCRLSDTRTHATSMKRRKGRVILPENEFDGTPLRIRDSADESPLFVFEEGATTNQDEVEENPSGLACAIAMASIAHETKGEDILVLHVAPLISWTDYMVFITVFSKPQLEAVLGKVEAEAIEKWDRAVRQVARSSRTEWELLDLGDVIVHVFTEREREHYNLEEFYAAAERVHLPFLEPQSAVPKSSEATAEEPQIAWSREE